MSRREREREEVDADVVGESENQHGGGGRCTYPAPSFLEGSKKSEQKRLTIITLHNTAKHYLVVLFWQLCSRASSKPFVLLWGGGVG